MENTQLSVYFNLPQQVRFTALSFNRKNLQYYIVIEHWLKSLR